MLWRLSFQGFGIRMLFIQGFVTLCLKVLQILDATSCYQGQSAADGSIENRPACWLHARA